MRYSLVDAREYTDPCEWSSLSAAPNGSSASHTCTALCEPLYTLSYYNKIKMLNNKAKHDCFHTAFLYSFFYTKSFRKKIS